MTTAPQAPGRLGVAAPASELLAYLAALGRWRDERKAELDRLDAAALASSTPQAYTGDLVLSMALWQSVAGRHDELQRHWDSGRADAAARERMSALIWGRMDANAAGMALTLVEACRLSDALVVQVRTRLSVDPSGSDDAARLRAARTAAERVRDLAEDLACLAVDAAAQVTKALSAVDADLAEAADWIARGADPGQRLASAEQRLARLERDAIVDISRRQQAVRDVEAARRLAADLDARGDALRVEAARIASGFRPAPRLGVPDVEALGPIPTDPDGVRAYLSRLDAVRRALDVAEAAYRAPAAEIEELRGRLGGWRAKLAARPLGATTLVADVLRAAEAALAPGPDGRVDLEAARAGLAAVGALAAAAGATPTTPTAPPAPSPRPWSPSRSAPADPAGGTP